MTPFKRLFDVIAALVLMAVLALPFAALVLWLLWAEGRPVFYISERMKTVDEPFRLWKLRTMRVSEDTGSVSGGHKADRITASGRFLRRTRLDEIPQLWNILRGDMSFVGPRPPLRAVVEQFPEIYGVVLRSRPGVTGLASLLYHRHEEAILAGCRTAEETEAVYARRCVPRKAALDLIYQRHAGVCFDLAILGQTVLRVARR